MTALDHEIRRKFGSNPKYRRAMLTQMIDDYEAGGDDRAVAIHLWVKVCGQDIRDLQQSHPESTDGRRKDSGRGVKK